MPKKKLTKRFIDSIGKPNKPKSYSDKGEKGLILRVTKTGTKTFSYRYYQDGNQKRYTIGRYPSVSLEDAREQVQRMKVNLLDGDDPQADRKEKRDSAKFRELADDFKTKHLRMLRESTRVEYERIIDVELVPELGSYSVDQIGKTHILRVLDDKAYNDNSPTMANYIRRVLSSIYAFGVKNDYVDSNPVEKSSPYKTVSKQPNTFYSEEDIKELWKFFGEQNQPMGELLKMLLLTGQRKTETANMRWTDIKRDVWTIPGELAKNGEPHEVPLGKIAQGIIEDLKPYSGDSDYVFLSPRNDSAPLKSTKNAAIRARKQTEVSDFKVHNLRRTVATHMAKMGIDRNTVGRVLNHKQSSGDDLITALYDRHSYLEQKEKALQKWEVKLYKIMGASSAQLMMLGYDG
ncbi:tyrosine-type recombinase/integrase [Fodinibius sp.]|uniref:tyrosine-type recombinase/integrase n=1 Tax=Fodinibius sp. TaxID=1872440 RepID=UPI002ACE29AF|nr:integrase arm-type DNA-binding domain-containing protein [Fodinibius sp.]MDZ7660050.1 integrase arm-type DNA-binding domain-containing protein [Fodinibius sp.]